MRIDNQEKRTKTIGEVYGNLEIIGWVYTSQKENRPICKCLCGGETISVYADLVKGRHTSCKCKGNIRAYKNGKLKIKEYERSTKNKFYQMYADIVKRTTNCKSNCYKRYGGRGILNKFSCFEDFIDYIIKLENYDKVIIDNLKIDRIDNNGNYEIGNLRFVTHRQNCSNREINKKKKNKYTGVVYDYKTKKYRSTIYINKKATYIGVYNNPEEARLNYLKKLITLNESNIYKKEIIKEIELLESELINVKKTKK